MMSPAQIGEFQVVTGANCTPEEVSAIVWPGNDRVVYLGRKVWGATASFFFLVDQTPPDDFVPAA